MSSEDHSETAATKEEGVEPNQPLRKRKKKAKRAALEPAATAPEVQEQESAAAEGEPSGEGNTQLWLVALGLILAGVLWGYRGKSQKVAPPALEVGSVIDLPITLVTADRQDLACAFSGEIQGYRCAWADVLTKNAPVPADRLLAPYLTTSGQIYLVAGLFEQSLVAQRYEREKPEGRKREELRRFTATCKLKLIGEAAEVRLQFAPDAPWGEALRIWAGVPLECTISHP